AKQNRLPVARVKNRAGAFVEPTLASTTAAVAASEKGLARDVRTPIANASGPGVYPICGLTFLLVERQPRDAAKGKALVEFLTWAMHDGQAIADDLNYAKLPEAVVHVNEAAFATIGATRRASR